MAVQKRKSKADRAKRETELARLFHFQTTWIKTSNDTLHLELAGQLLRRSLARKDYERAFNIYSTLMSCKSANEELIWKVGSEILSQNNEYEPLCLRFLQLVFAKSKHCRESILVEIALYQLRCGQINDARTTLEPYINAYPYRENAQLQGYAGVVEFALFNMAVKEKNESQALSILESHDPLDQNTGSFNGDSQGGNDGFDDDNDSDGEGGDGGTGKAPSLWDARVLRHKRAAVNHLELALKLDNRNDSFLTYLVRLKCGRIEMTGWDKTKASDKRKAAIREMKEYLKLFYNDNNNSMLALRLLAALENRKRQKTLEIILAKDPVSDSELYVRPLVKLMWKSLPLDQQEIIYRIENTKHHEGPDASGAKQTYPFQDSNSNRLPASIAEKQRRRADTEESLDEDERMWSEMSRVRKEQKDKNRSGEVDRQHRRSRSDKHGDSSPTFLRDQLVLEAKYVRPILQLLLTRAEFGTMAPWEELEVLNICRLYSVNDNCHKAEARKSKWRDNPRGMEPLLRSSPGFEEEEEEEKQSFILKEYDSLKLSSATTDTDKKDEQWIRTVFGKYGGFIRHLRIQSKILIDAAFTDGACRGLCSLELFNLKRGFTRREIEEFSQVLKQAAGGVLTPAWREGAEEGPLLSPIFDGGMILPSEIRRWRTLAQRECDWRLYQQLWLLVHENGESLRRLWLDWTLDWLGRMVSTELFSRILAALPHLVHLDNNSHVQDFELLARRTMDSLCALDVSGFLPVREFFMILKCFRNLEYLRIESVEQWGGFWQVGLDAMELQHQEYIDVVVGQPGPGSHRWWQGLRLKNLQVWNGCAELDEKFATGIIPWLPELAEFRFNMLLPATAQALVTYCKGFRQFRQSREDYPFVDQAFLGKISFMKVTVFPLFPLELPFYWLLLINGNEREVKKEQGDQIFFGTDIILITLMAL
ncbi:hypothetical protein BGX23_009886 [Mortierella sp. AD031]|nr:hypothetical protein BGX23_009886 [Mortierella sp. AD031]